VHGQLHASCAPPVSLTFSVFTPPGRQACAPCSCSKVDCGCRKDTGMCGGASTGTCTTYGPPCWPAAVAAAQPCVCVGTGGVGRTERGLQNKRAAEGRGMRGEAARALLQASLHESCEGWVLQGYRCLGCGTSPTGFLQAFLHVRGGHCGALGALVAAHLPPVCSCARLQDSPG